MTTLTAANKKMLNRMNKSACTVALGTNLQLAQTAIISNTGSIVAIQSASGFPALPGVKIVSTAEMSASKCTILNAAFTNGAIWQYTRNGSPVTTISASFVKASGSLDLRNYDLNSGSMKPGDVVWYILY
jgi:hypothetical protein